MNWRDAVLASLYSYSDRHHSRVVDRQLFIDEELGNITSATNSAGKTPTQTLSRILQELRDDGLMEFLEPGQYLLLDSAIDAESEDLTDEALDIAIKASKLKLGRVDTADEIRRTRQRRGQDRLRKLVLQDYGHRCAVCDITDSGLLIASHIIGWADPAEHRGELANVICLCRIHDCLFERGYWSISDSNRILKRQCTGSQMLAVVLQHLDDFRIPSSFPPARMFLENHRRRFGFDV